MEGIGLLTLSNLCQTSSLCSTETLKGSFGTAGKRTQPDQTRESEERSWSPERLRTETKTETFDFRSRRRHVWPRGLSPSSPES